MSSAERCRVWLLSRISRIFSRGSVTFRPALRRSLPSMPFSPDASRIRPGRCGIIHLLSRIQVTSHVIRFQSVLPWHRMGAACACLALLAAASGCVYRVTVQQGNYLEKRNTDQLTTGMTKVQVRYLLGTPMMPSLFENQRWDYLYYLKVGRNAPIERQLTVYFKDDKVEKIDRHGQEAVTPDAPEGRVP